MKCQKCQKQATYHITDITQDGSPLALHFCPECAAKYLKTEDSATEGPMSSLLQQQLKPLEQTAEELRDLDSRVCPICGISFYEFRQAGRLGCPHDYVYFQSELEPLLVNVHGANHHVGKQPLRGVRDTASQTELIRLRREMKEVIEQEDYEKATQLRDRIRQIEAEGRPSA